ncbi:hypothetical protein B0A77_14365 [Flavobacterium branchiophilum]|uniref:Uncharacterized protein n=1 Tax=Flavobacterium branchiophilum TaxID=55197 RepID=A0A2H3K8Q4_9FLAO|nr:hypothetical protein B0A77_14365 [Flavobacterium branchiophilum]
MYKKINKYDHPPSSIKPKKSVCGNEKIRTPPLSKFRTLTKVLETTFQVTFSRKVFTQPPLSKFGTLTKVLETTFSSCVFKKSAHPTPFVKVWYFDKGFRSKFRT